MHSILNTFFSYIYDSYSWPNGWTKLAEPKKRDFSRRILKKFYFYGQTRALEKVVYRDKLDKLDKFKQM